MESSTQGFRCQLCGTPLLDAKYNTKYCPDCARHRKKQSDYVTHHRKSMWRKRDRELEMLEKQLKNDRSEEQWQKNK